MYEYQFRPEVDAVVAVPTFEAALARVLEETPHVVVYNPGADAARAELFLQRLFAAHPAVSAISVGDALSDQVLDRHMSLGVRFHFNRALSHPRDVIVAVRHSLASTI